MNNSSQPAGPLSLTPRFSGVIDAAEETPTAIAVYRWPGARHHTETAKAVELPTAHSVTPLKRGANGSLSLLAATALLLLLFAGCATSSVRDLTLGPSYQPANTFCASPILPLTLKRVAVLPLAADGSNLQLVDARPALERVLRSEVAKTRKFEMVEVSPEFLQSHTGRGTWGGEEALPADLLEALRRAFGCDAVLFCRLTVFRGYAPLAVGWRLRLVAAPTAETLWAADELFDAGQPAVTAGARRYQLAELRTGGESPEEWTIAHSPRQFAQYAAAQVLATLPQR